MELDDYAAMVAAKRAKRKNVAAREADKKRSHHAQHSDKEKRFEREMNFQEYQERERYERRHSIEGLDECVLKEISHRHNNSELLEFVRTLYKYGLEIDKQDAHDLCMKGEALTDELKKKAEELEKIREQLEEAGITLEPNNFRSQIVLNSFFTMSLGPEDEVGYSYNESYLTNNQERVYKHYQFNGLELTEEVLKDPNYNGFYTEYESLKSAYEPAISREDELTRRLKRNSSLLRFSIFNRESMKKENEDIEDTLKKIQNYKNRIEAARRRYESFKELTREQKKSILEYIQNREQCENLEQEIKEKVCSELDMIYPEHHGNIAQYAADSHTQARDKWNRALKLMIEEGIITREDLTKVVQMFEEVQEKQQNNEYDEDFKSWSSDDDGMLERYKKGIKWFIENIYRSKEEKEKSEEI